MKLIQINEFSFFVKSSISVLQACRYLGIIIPHFCYHETLSVSGNCRMCLIEIVSSPKPTAACALPVLNNMKIFIDSPLVKKARENMLEFLLLNHPLDCPICDQGGECDLQDQSFGFGSDHSRLFLVKRGIEDKYFGPLIKGIMTRCIHCTRCIRFSVEVAGVSCLGTIGRGSSVEIGGYLSSIFISEISGNVIDLCPVGALTAKSYAFKARPWELRMLESVDITDGVGSSIYISVKDSEIVRILPKLDLHHSSSIITDKCRFYFDSNKHQRLDKLLVKNNYTLKFSNTNWIDTFSFIDSEFSSAKSILILISVEEVDLNSLIFLNFLANKSNSRFKIKSVDLRKSSVSNFYLSWIKGKISDLSKFSRFCFLFCSNIRLESAILNTKLRQKFLFDNTKVYGLSAIHVSNFSIEFVNISIYKFLFFLEGKDAYLSKVLIKDRNPLIFFGEILSLRGFSLNNITKFIKSYVPSSILINIQTKASAESLNLLNIGRVHRNDIRSADFCFAADLPSTFFLSKYISSHTNLVWLNTHNSNLALKAARIIPLSTSFEDKRILISLEEKIQISNRILPTLGLSRSFLKFIKSFILTNQIIQFNKSLVYSFNILENNILFNSTKLLLSSPNLLKNLFIIQNEMVSTYLIKSCLADFYCSSKMSRNSFHMLHCSRIIRKMHQNFSFR